MTSKGAGRHYEIHVAGALSEVLTQVFSEMRTSRIKAGSLLRIQVPEDTDAADIAIMLRDRGHTVLSVRRCDDQQARTGGR